MIGPSRLYLGVHWFSDVATGFALAGLRLVPMLVTAAIYRHRHPATARDGRDRRIPLIPCRTRNLAGLSDVYKLGQR